MKLLTTTITVMSIAVAMVVLWSSAYNDPLAGQPYLIIHMKPQAMQNAAASSKIEARFQQASHTPTMAPSEATVSSSKNEPGAVDDQWGFNSGFMDQPTMGQQTESKNQETIRRHQQELSRAFQ